MHNAKTLHPNASEEVLAKCLATPANVGVKVNRVSRASQLIKLITSQWLAAYHMQLL